MLFYRASLPPSRQTLNFAAGIIRRHRISIGSLWRKLNPGQQARLVLVYLRETFASLAAGFGPRQKAEWMRGVLAELEDAGLVTLADKGYQGSTYAKIPYKGKNKPDSQKQANKAHAKLRAPGERANAQLKTWKILTKLRCCPWRAGQLARAIHALQLRET
jgi:DDE superfamily endonuclease